MARLLRTINIWTHKTFLLIAELALGAMVLIVTVTVILRYAFNTGIGWAEEVPRLLVTLFAFIACAMGVRDHMHVSVNILYNSLPKGGKARRVMEILTDLVILLCGVFMLYYGLMQVIRISGRPGILPMTQWPTWIQYIPIPLAGFVMTFDSLLFLTGVLKTDDLLFTEKEVDYTEQVKQDRLVREAKEAE